MYNNTSHASKTPHWFAAMPAGRRSLMVLSIYFIGWFALEYISTFFEAVDKVSVWDPAEALSFVLLFVFGVRYTPALMIAIIAHIGITSGRALSPLYAFLAAINTTVCYGGACYLLLRVLRINPRLRQLRDVGWFIVVGIIIAPFIKAFFQILIFALVGMFSWYEGSVLMLRYWSGDVTGTAMFAPFLLVVLRALPWIWAEPEAATIQNVHQGTNFYWPTTRWEVAQFLGVVTALGLSIWAGYVAPRNNTLDYTYAVFMPMTLIAVRYGFSTTTLAILLTNISIVLLVSTRGNMDTIALQFGLMTLTTTSLMLGAFITDRRHIGQKLHESTELLQQAQKMEAIGRLAGGVAHDFNNLLAVIIGQSDLLLRRLSEGDSVRSKIEEIHKAANRAAALTRQLLAFSRKQIMRPQVLDLNHIVTHMAQMLERLIGAHIEIFTRLEPRLWNIKADQTQIERMIVNLAVNARDAMPKGGTLSIETANVIFGSDNPRPQIMLPPGAYVLLRISDTGHGIDAQTREHIFEPFFTTKEVGKGTGLGLATVYGIVRQSDGDVHVESTVGHGTSFDIYLPRATEDVREYGSETLPRAATVAQSVNEPETVLLVEDQEIVRGTVRECLVSEGYQVLEASNGDQALQICQQHTGPIDLLLTDMVMPRMSGRELAVRVQQIKPDMGVLYISGYTEGAGVDDSVSDDRTAFLQKPFSVDDLARKVREILDASHSRH